MSYTLTGRIQSRLAALLPVLLAACALAGALRHWWPVELVALMAAVGVALDVQLWHRLLPYQPAWAMVPLGAIELGLVMAIVAGFGLHAPVVPAQRPEEHRTTCPGGHRLYRIEYRFLRPSRRLA